MVLDRGMQRTLSVIRTWVANYTKIQRTGSFILLSQRFVVTKEDHQVRTTSKATFSFTMPMASLTNSHSAHGGWKLSRKIRSSIAFPHYSSRCPITVVSIILASLENGTSGGSRSVPLVQTIKPILTYTCQETSCTFTRYVDISYAFGDTMC